MNGRMNRLALHRETLRNLTDGELGQVAGAMPPTYTMAMRAYSVRQEYTCQCDTNPQHGCEGLTTDWSATCLCY